MITLERAHLNKLNESELTRLHQLMVFAYEITEREIWGIQFSFSTPINIKILNKIWRVFFVGMSYL